MRFGLASAVLAGVIWVLASGFTPPGIAGEVIRHNREADIDASPLFYTEVENMAELEEGLHELISEKTEE